MKRIYWIMLFSVVIVFGSNYTIVRIGILYSSPLAFSVLRVAGACLVATPFSAYAAWKIHKKNRAKLEKEESSPLLPVGKKMFGIIALYGTTSSTFFFGFWFTGEALTSASVSAVIVNTIPLFTVLLTRFFLQERMNRKQMLGLVLGFTGAFTVASNGSIYNLYGDWRGFAFLFLSAASSATSLIIYKRSLAHYEQNTVNALQLFFAAIGLFVWAVASNPHSFETIIWTNQTFQEAVLYSALTATPVNLIWMALIRQMGPAWFSTWLFLNPVSAVIISSLVLGERLLELQLVGMALVVFSIYQINRARLINETGGVGSAASYRKTLPDG
ncbi:MAG: DMT family transporter [Nitrososphaerales archaeon]